MLINRLALKNFKCFKEVDVTFAKLTLLTGENSSGKTSLLSGILAPLQSKDFPFYLSPNGQYVNLGDFEEMSFNHLKDNEIDIELVITGHLPPKRVRFKTTWVIDNLNRLPVLNSLNIRVVRNLDL
jgi:predicted ATP-dependent endonuclease of OLD family